MVTTDARRDGLPRRAAGRTVYPTLLSIARMRLVPFLRVILNVTLYVPGCDATSLSVTSVRPRGSALLRREPFDVGHTRTRGPRNRSPAVAVMAGGWL